MLENAFDAARMVETASPILRHLEQATDAARLIEQLAPPSHLSRMIELMQPSASERAAHQMVRDLGHADVLSDVLARDSMRLGHPYFDVSTASAIRSLEKGILANSFDVVPEWMRAMEARDRIWHDALTIPDALSMAGLKYELGQSDAMRRLLSSTQDVASIAQDMERRWLDMIAPSKAELRAQHDFANLTDSANRTWAALADAPARLGLMSPALARAPGREIYLAAQATSLLVGRYEPLEIGTSDDVEADILVMGDSFDARLRAFDPDLLSMYRGGTDSIRRSGADVARHALISFRELVMHLIHALAPDSEVALWAQPAHYDEKGRLTRRARLEFIFRDCDGGDFADFMKKDYAAAISLIELLNKVHKKTPEIREGQLRVLRSRVQGFISVLLEVSGN